MRVSVLVPYRPGDPDREAAWEWLERRYTKCQPGVDLVVADEGGEPFSRAASLNVAAEQAAGDVLVLADADVVMGPGSLEAAAEEAVRAPGLVVAFTRWLALTSEATAEILAGPVDVWAGEPASWWSTDWSLGAAVAVSRQTWEASGGFDPRFRGWGFEDVAFACATRALAGPDRRMPGDLWHLWHPSAADPASDTYQANFALEQRYEHGSVEDIRGLITERSRDARVVG